MIASLSFGKYLTEATNFYKLRNYLEADSILDKALRIKKSDFRANFLKIRISVMQNNYQKAIDLIKVCKTFKSSSELKDLLIPWEKMCLNEINQTNETIDIIDLNNRTDDLLEYYQHYRIIGFRDLLITILSFIGVAAIVVWSHLLSRKLQNFFTVSIYTLFILFYYYSKTILNTDIYNFGWYILKRTKELLHSKFLINCCMFISIGVIFYGLRKKALDINPHFELAIFIMICFVYPIGEEVLMRGFLYNYLLKYGKKLSWLIVTLIFLIMHGANASSWHIILSIVCLSAYDKEKTILAPIFVHIVNNVLANIFFPTNF